MNLSSVSNAPVWFNVVVIAQIVFVIAIGIVFIARAYVHHMMKKETSEEQQEDHNTLITVASTLNHFLYALLVIAALLDFVINAASVYLR